MLGKGGKHFGESEGRSGITSAHASSQLEWVTGLTPPKIIPCKDLSLGMKAVTMQLHTHGMHHKQGQLPGPDNKAKC